MLPLKDNIPTERFPIVTLLLVGINVLVFLYELSLGQGLDRFLATYGMTPYEITHGVSLLPREVPVYATLFTSMFLHAGILHLGGNMLFLWIFGNNVEDSMGRFRFVIFYLMCGLIASMAQIIVGPASQIPNVGASGAIAGVLGGYILLFPRARVTTLIFLGFFITFIELPAMLVLFLWMAFQVVSGVTGLYSSMADGGVAYFAHIGGFIVGLLTIRLFTMGKHGVSVKRGYLQR
ncbi:MAG: rhomboid family intramembrane serine protease [Thermoleophilia bacterium]